MNVRSWFNYKRRLAQQGVPSSVVCLTVSNALEKSKDTRTNGCMVNMVKTVWRRIMRAVSVVPVGRNANWSVKWASMSAAVVISVKTAKRIGWDNSPPHCRVALVYTYQHQALVWEIVMSGCREVVVTMVTRVNIWTLAIALLTSVMIPVFYTVARWPAGSWLTRAMIYRSALCDHPLHALTTIMTRGTATIHTTAPLCRTRRMLWFSCRGEIPF